MFSTERHTWGESAADGVADLVVGNQALALAVQHGSPLHTSHDAVHAVVDLLVRDGGLASPSRQNSGLTPKITKITLWHLACFLVLYKRKSMWDMWEKASLCGKLRPVSKITL